MSSNEQLIPEKSIEEITLQLANSTGLKGLIDDVSKDQNLTDFSGLTDIPIPPELLPQEEINIGASSAISKQIHILLAAINEEHTALEYPFFLSGKDGTVDDLALLFNDNESLQARIVDINAELLGIEVKKATGSNKNIFIVAHTHPKVNKSEAKKVLTSKVSSEVKEKHGIRDIGLNLSFQDLYQLVGVQKALNRRTPKNSNIYSGILMYNGEMHLLSIREGKFKRIQLPYNV